MSSFVLRLLFLLAVATASSACGGSSSSTASASTDITANLTDTAIQLDRASAAPGVVSIKAHNAGTVAHSLLLIKTDVAADKLSPDPKDASRIDRTGEVRETAQIPAGQNATLIAPVAAGNYVLICNEPGHYLIGMRIALSVK